MWSMWMKTRTICSLPATFRILEQTFYSICYYIVEKESKFTFLGMRKTGSWDAEFIWILCCCCFSSVLTGLYIFSIGSIDSWKTINTVGFVSSLTIIILFILFLNVGNLTLCFYSNAAWLSGIVQTGIYADFFYYYIKRYILFCYAISGEMQNPVYKIWENFNGHCVSVEVTKIPSLFGYRNLLFILEVGTTIIHSTFQVFADKPLHFSVSSWKDNKNLKLPA